MNFINLPEDILIFLFKNFLNLNDLFVLSTTCKKINIILLNYKIWSKFKKFYPIIDFNFPSGYEDYLAHSVLYHKLRTDRYKLKIAFKWIHEQKYSQKIIYKYHPKKLVQKKMNFIIKMIDFKIN
jgi:hypothetical protein